jgi:hypothetical protein
MMEDGRAGHCGLTERPILNELNVIVAEGAEKGSKVIVYSSEELARKFLLSVRKSPSNCLAARRGLICKTSRSGAVNPLRGSASRYAHIWCRHRQQCPRRQLIARRDPVRIV